MAALIVEVPKGDVRFFKSIASRMGWRINTAPTASYSPEMRSESPAMVQEEALDSIDRAFGQLRQMQAGELEGVSAEELYNEL